MASGWTRQPPTGEESFHDAPDVPGQASAEGQENAGKASSWWGRTKQDTGSKTGEAVGQARETSEEASAQAREKGGQLKDQAGEKAGQAKEEASDVAGRAKEQASSKASEAKEKAGGAAEQTKEKAGEATDRVKEKGQEVWDSEKGQQVRSQASEYGQRAGDTARKTKDTVGEGGHQFMTEIREEGEGQGPGGELGRRTKQAGRLVHDKAQEVVENPEVRHNLAEDAGRFLGAMRAQGGGVGQEAEAFGRGAQMVSETAQQTWEHVPEEAKDTVIRGGKKVAETTDRLWTKFFQIVEKVLDLTEQKLFHDEDDEDDVEAGQGQRGDEHSQTHPNQGGTSNPLQPLLQKPGFLKGKDPKQKEKERKDKEKKKKQQNVKLVSQVIGGFIALLLSTILLFFLGFFLLPILLISLLLLLLVFQCYACCGVRA